MAKNGMRIVTIIIMILTILGFTKANINSPFAQVESSSDSKKSLCEFKCSLYCVPYISYPPIYKKCLDDCYAKCPKMSNDVYNCMTDCALIKSIDLNSGIYSLTTFAYF